ncbi:hypothetical protein GMDG_01492 [Pseudogymnoascus destructans 20631-21]|uniref:N-acetyltransferase domain-containing protein n=1 Tax=Pseudogymnoascus destructans (strain ATCC MYA-4855 / 20631-21) TaxID=658429 RepID=L8FXH5_PSED2|nr:hypothetical protein GMDG_01492 [Pseudogymnoascus destructans 20631-21]
MGPTTNPLMLELATAEDVPTIFDVWFAAFTQPTKYLRIVDPESKDKQGRPRIVAFGMWDLDMPSTMASRLL